MKFRISPAAAAVFLAAGLFNSGLRAASAPAAIPFENDAAFNVTLSNTNPSKVVVDGELITSISGPTGAYDQSQTDDGALILSPLVSQNFTLFIQTDRGSSLSLNIRPQPGIWYGQHQQEQKQPAPVATPNMTGVVTAAFNQQVNDAALAQQQSDQKAECNEEDK
nr:type-F conjugative transfer system secretin TraK [Enterobacter roggenkampii]